MLYTPQTYTMFYLDKIGEKNQNIILFEIARPTGIYSF